MIPLFTWLLAAKQYTHTQHSLTRLKTLDRLVRENEGSSSVIPQVGCYSSIYTARDLRLTLPVTQARSAALACRSCYCRCRCCSFFTSTSASTSSASCITHDRLLLLRYLLHGGPAQRGLRPPAAQE